MKYKMLIFDLDGTTLDTLKDLTSSVNYVLRLHGFPARTEREVRDFLGNGIRRLIELSAPKDCPPRTIDAIYGEFLPYYKAHAFDCTKPYGGITEALKTLKNAGYLLGLVSNKADVVVKGLVSRFFNGIFDYATGQVDGVNKKPAPDAVNILLKKFNVASAEALYIGDSEVDYLTGVNAHTDVMLVSYGFRDRDLLERLKPKYLVDSVKEIVDILSA